jgi:5-methylcytosine-specific restriction endonuclease McrA
MSAADNYKRFLLSDLWREKRKLVLARDHHRCQVCSGTDALHVHHLAYSTRWGEEALSDLTTACSGCHWMLHTGSWAMA